MYKSCYTESFCVCYQWQIDDTIDDEETAWTSLLLPHMSHEKSSYEPRLILRYEVE